MLDTWTKSTFDRLPVTYKTDEPITYRVYIKKDIEGRYWLITYSVAMPAFRYVGKFKDKWNVLLDSGNIEEIHALLDDSTCYISSWASTTKLEDTFEAFSSWVRNPIGKDRIRNSNPISYNSLEDYLNNFTTDKSIIVDIVEALGVFCKDN